MTGRALQQYREKHKISRAAFCRWSSLSYSAVQKWERTADRRIPPWGVKLLIAYVEKVRAARQAAEAKKSSAV